MSDPIIPSHPHLELAREAAEQPQVFAAAFNSGDPELLESVYESAGALVAQPGEATLGVERREANARLMRLGVPIAVSPRHVYTVGDIALLIVDWRIAGTTAAGEEVDITGTALASGPAGS